VSRAQTVTIANITTISTPGSRVSPTVIARSIKTPQRALLSNTGPAALFIAFSAQAVSNFNSVQDAFVLNPGQSVVFTLEATDSLYSAALGAGGQLSIHVSPAFPLGTWGAS
jgi:hypothetical protein